MTRPKNPAFEVEQKARLREVIAAILSWQYHFLSIAFNVKRQPLYDRHYPWGTRSQSGVKPGTASHPLFL